MMPKADSFTAMVSDGRDLQSLQQDRESVGERVFLLDSRVRAAGRSTLRLPRRRPFVSEDR